MESRQTNNLPTGGSVVESADWVITGADSITVFITDSRKLLCWYRPLRLASVTYYYQMYLLPQIPQGGGGLQHQSVQRCVPGIWKF